jgi:hypothetical protein
METKEVVRTMSDFVNSFSVNHHEFCEEMSKEHRTLQQSFTRLCLKWIEHVASEEYRTDGRNEASQKISRELLELFREKKSKEGYSGATLELMSKPSGYCSII